MDFLTGINVLVVSTTVVVGVLISVHYYYKNIYSYWQRRGLKNPQPIPIFGNALQVIFKDRANLDREWSRKFGKLFGIYVSREPRLIVADADVLNQICIKDFDSFPNHERNEFITKFQKSFLISLQDEHWKKVRALMTPTFTSGKIKRMFKFLDACADDLVRCFEEHSTLDKNGVVNVKEIYNLYTMDAVATCCYGLKLERLSETRGLKAAASRNDFVRVAMKLFEFSYARFVIYFSLPKKLLEFINFSINDPNQYKELATKASQLIQIRKQRSLEKGKKFDDYLQLLIDAELNDQMELNEMDQEENHHAGLTKESLLDDQHKMVSSIEASQGEQVKLNDYEIIANAMLLLAVGLETTGTLLANTTYLLAFHPEIQQKLYEELRKICQREGDKFSFEYESVTSCKYLDAVISESLRILSPVITLDRVAKKDCFIEKYNLTIPKDMRVNLAYYAIMNHPDYWPQPERFDPERFMPGNKEKIVSGSYCPFGLGPRHCIGMRFSLTESKLALAKVVTQFKFTPAPGTEFPPKFNSKMVLFNLKDPLVKLSLREN